MSGYEDFRRHNDEVNRKADDRHYHENIRIREQADIERRHREQIRALGRGAGSQHYSFQSGGLSFRTTLKLFAFGAALFVAAIFVGSRWTDQESSATDRESLNYLPMTSRPDAAAVFPTEHRNQKAGGEKEFAGELGASAPAPPTGTSGENHFQPESGLAAMETLEALRAGTHVLWRDGDKSGYVLVSEAQMSEGRSCRNVSYSLIQPDGQIQSEPAVWCEAAGGEWTKS